MQFIPVEHRGFAVPPSLTKVLAPRVVWALPHKDSDCWVSIRQIGHAFFVEWRSGLAYACPPTELIASLYSDGTKDENILAAIARAEDELLHSPPDTTVSTRAEWIEKYGSCDGDAHKKGGATTAAKAKEKRDKARVEAAVSSEPGAPVALPEAPVELLQNEFWEIAESEALDDIVYNSVEVPGTYLRVTLNPDGFWRVRRHFYSDGDASKMEHNDAVRTLSRNKDGKFERYEAIEVANKLALTDLKTWKRGEYNP